MFQWVWSSYEESMPIYEYRCKKCDHSFEKLMRHNERDDTQLCPKCENKTKRIVSKSSFSLKGGGWASDGYSG